MVYDLIHNFKYAQDIRVFAAGNFFLQKVQKLNKQLLKLINYEAGETMSFTNFTAILEAFKVFLINIVAIYYYFSGEITLAEFCMYTMAVNVFVQNMDKLGEGIININKNREYVEHYFTFLNLEYPQKKHKDKTAVPHKNLLSLEEGKVESLEFKNVYFHYPHNEKDIIKNLSFVVKAGEKIGLVGPNGGGKSTLVKLMLGLYPVTEGEILLNGRNINTYQPETYGHFFSGVFQDYTIFPLSIGENIGAAQVYDETRIKDVLGQLGFSNKLENLPQGLATIMVKDYAAGARELSIGEQQAVALARCFYKDSSILILDEPTASLDLETELEVYQMYSNLSKDKMSFFISHRLAGIQFCDRVFVLKEGRIAEEGSPASLMRRNSVYREMFNKQKKSFVN